MKAKIIKLKGSVCDNEYYALDVINVGLNIRINSKAEGVILKLPKFNYDQITNPHKFFKQIETAINKFC